MDEAFNQHSPHSRHHNKSATSLNALSLAPLTSRLPIDDADADADEAHIPRHPHSPRHHTSYLEHSSVPPTPGILSSRPSSRSASRVGRRPLSAIQPIPKSKSSTHIHTDHLACQPKHHRHKSGAVTPGPRPTHTYKHSKCAASDDFALGFFAPRPLDGAEDDWLLRAGALMTSGARKSKGQDWLVSRASSTSLTRQRVDSDSDDDDADAVAEYGFAGPQSRRDSRDADDEISPVTTRSFIAHSRSASRFNSRAQSRAQSRVQSRRGSRVELALTPSTQGERGEFFEAGSEGFAEPDFVNLDEDEADAEAQALADELLVRRLAKTGTLGLGTWVERLMGWSLFAVDEDGEESDEDGDTEGDGTTDAESEGQERKGRDGRKSKNEREREHWREMLERDAVDQGLVLPPPPKSGEEGGWGDAAWLLSVATKVLL